MAFSAGVYTLPTPALVPGQTVASTENNTFRNDVATAFNLTMLRNGTSTATANLPMGGYKLTGLGAPTTNGDALSYGNAAVVTSLTSTSLTATRVPYAGTGGLLQDASTFTFDGTTLTAGGFTTSGAISAGTITASGNITVSGGTANGVAYLNGSKVLTTGNALQFDGTNLGIGIFPTTSLDVAGPIRSRVIGGIGQLYLNNGTTQLSIDNNGGQMVFTTASASEQMRLTSTGLGIGTSSPGQKLAVVANDSLNAGVAATLIRQNGSAGNNGLIVDVTNTPNAYVADFRIANSSVMRLDQSGNLGIGVTPSAWNTGKALSIYDAGSSVWANSNGSIGLMANGYYNSGWKYQANGYAMRLDVGNANGTFSISTAPSGTAGNAISFTQAMTLDSSGNLGIGTSSPGTKLDVQSSDSTAYTTSSNGNLLRLYNTNTTSGVYSGILLTAMGNGALAGSASINAIQTGDGSAAIGFTTRNGGTSAERMRIDSSGRVFVNTTSVVGGNSRISVLFDGSSGNGINLQTTLSGNGSDYLAFYASSGTNTGYIRQNGTNTVAFSTSSDYRLKENIQPMQNALATVAQLNPVTYTWKADGSDGQGFIAHELQAVVPDCVTGEKDAVDADGNPVYQGIDTSFLVATLTKAIQEQQEQIEQLKAEVAALKGV